MENDLYAKLSKEISLNLPDINFDSDSDDELSNKEPIKPYIRPPAEILFGNEDLGDDEKELLDMLSKLPSDFERPIEDETSSSKGCNTVDLTSFANGDVEFKRTCYNGDDSMEIPFNNIQLPNGIRTFEKSEIDTEQNKRDRLELAKFGTRDNIDIDKALEELEIDSSKYTFFDDVLSEIDVSNNHSINDEGSIEKESELFKKLDAMATKYQELANISRQPKVEYKEYAKKEIHLSLSDLLLQSKKEASSEMVFLDLRPQNNSCLIENKFEPKQIYNLSIISESSDEEDENEDDNNELWIGNYRRVKQEINKTQMHTTNSNETESSNTICSNELKIEEIKPIISTEKNLTENQQIENKKINEREDEKKVEKVNYNDDSDAPISEHIRIKIENMKQKEKKLSERRSLLNQIKECITSFESTPLLIHEELSFTPSSYSLLPCLETTTTPFYSVTINFQPPCTLLSTSRIPTTISDIAHINFIHTISLLINPLLTQHHCKFITRSAQILNGDQIKLLITTQLSSITKLKAHLKTINIKSIYENITPKYCYLLSNLPLSNLMKIQPYSDDIDLNNEWKWNNSSITWLLSNQINHNNDVINNNDYDIYRNVENSCIIVQPKLYEDVHKWYSLLMDLLQRFYISGLRLIYKGDSVKLAMILRGHNVINYVKTISSEFKDKTLFTCTRFEESFIKEAIEYFGPRFNETELMNQISSKSPKQMSRLLSGAAKDIYSPLFYLPITHNILLISPNTLDIGWTLNTLWESAGLKMLNNWRLKLDVEQIHELLGSNEEILFKNKNQFITNIIQITQEASDHVINFAMRTCRDYMIHSESNRFNCQDQKSVSVEELFCSLPYNSQTIDVLNLKNHHQVPSIRASISNLPHAPYSDCEQFSFVLLLTTSSITLTTLLLPQLFDMTSHLDILASKIFVPPYSSLSNEHQQLLLHTFNLSPLPSPPYSCALLVYRSMFLHSELDKVQETMKKQPNLIIAYTLEVEHTFRMIGSFFSNNELNSDPRRRSILSFIPNSIITKLQSETLTGQLKLIYEPIKSGFSLILHERDNLCSKLRKFWFLLNREGFIVSDISCNLIGSRQFTMVTTRPNAVFMLQQWANNFFSNDKPETLKIMQDPNNIEEFQDKILKSRSQIHESVNDDNPNSVLVCLDDELMSSSVDSVAILKLFWNFIDENHFNATSAFKITVDGSVEYRLIGRAEINNLKGQKISSGQYLVFIFEGSMARVVFKDLFKSKCQLMNANEILWKKIFISNEVKSCCDIFMN